MKLGETDDDHAVSDPNCESCWTAYPRQCEKPDCSGFVHASFGDENYDGDYWLYTKCDVCGEPE